MTRIDHRAQQDRHATLDDIRQTVLSADTLTARETVDLLDRLVAWGTSTGEKSPALALLAEAADLLRADVDTLDGP